MHPSVNGLTDKRMNGNVHVCGASGLVAMATETGAQGSTVYFLSV